jgi:hypothetical protein
MIKLKKIKKILIQTQYWMTKFEKKMKMKGKKKRGKVGKTNKKSIKCWDTNSKSFEC